MRLLLYGGTFDPPHNGHLHNLQAAAARVKPDLVIVMPAGVPPHKAASHTPAALRLEMCGCFAALGGTANIPRLEVSSWEIRQAETGVRNYTLDTVKMLEAAYAGAEIFLAVGSDMLLSFDTWHCWQALMQRAALVVTSRESDDAAVLHAKAAQLDPAGERILFAAVSALPMASHTLRARLAAGESCAEALPACVRAVIRREGLYRTADGERLEKSIT